MARYRLHRAQRLEQAADAHCHRADGERTTDGANVAAVPVVPQSADAPTTKMSTQKGPVHTGKHRPHSSSNIWAAIILASCRQPSSPSRPARAMEPSSRKARCRATLAAASPAQAAAP